MADARRGKRVTKIITAAAALLLLATSGLAQSKKAARGTDSDRLGMTCTQILKLTSTEWVEKFVAAKSGGAQEAAPAAEPPEARAETIRAVSVYGKCYDARTNRLEAALGRAGKGPLMGARGDFGDFEKALEDFQNVALQDSQPPANDVKTAYAALYEKQFRYAFYSSYEPATQKATPSGPPAKKPAVTKSAASAASPAQKAETGESSSLRKPGADAEGPDDQEAASDTADEFTKIKNRFGQLLEALPEDKAHEVHEAFGTILGAYEISEETRREVYLYAIFLLEPESAKPYAPPPF